MLEGRLIFLQPPDPWHKLAHRSELVVVQDACLYDAEVRVEDITRVVRVGKAREAMHALLLKEKPHHNGLDSQIIPAAQEDHARVVKVLEHALHVGLQPARHIGNEEVVVVAAHWAAVCMGEDAVNLAVLLNACVEKLPRD